MTTLAMKTSLQNKYLGNGDCFVIIASSSISDRVRCKWTARSSIEVNIENGRFTIACSHCCTKLKFGNFTLVDCERIVLNCMPHVQHNYSSSFNQSDHCFLVLWLPLPSSLLQLPNAAELRAILLSLRKLRHFLISRHVSML